MRVAWAVPLPSPPLGLGLAREAGLVLVRHAQALALFGLDGAPVVGRDLPGPLAAACSAEDGRTFAAATANGGVLVLRGLLTPGWERAVPRRPVATALEALGRLLAVADEAGGLYVFDADGREVWKTSTARPLLHLAWVPETAALFGCAESGLACLHDHAGKLLWRDGLMANVGGIAASGDGKSLLAACFTEGLKRYGAEPGKPTAIPAAARQVAASYAGTVLATVALDGTTVALRDAKGKLLGEAGAGVAAGRAGDGGAGGGAGGGDGGRRAAPPALVNPTVPLRRRSARPRRDPRPGSPWPSPWPVAAARRRPARRAGSPRSR